MRSWAQGLVLADAAVLGQAAPVMFSAVTLVDTSSASERHLALSGRLTIAHLAVIEPAFAALIPDARRLVIDLAAIERIDTSGAWLVHRLLRDWQTAGVEAQIINADAATMRLIAEVAANDRPCEVRPALPNLLVLRLSMIGAALVHAVDTLGNFLAFLGRTLITLYRMMIERRPLRWHAVVHQMEVVGVNALGIVALLSFLIGIVLAQQGAVQLRAFGAEVFVVNLIGRSVVRELGLLLTAIMVAGRSGSAFAAQIGSMKLAQEIDAMATIGLSPIEVLVLPRLIAMAVMMVLLGFFGSMMAILGGGLYCWAALNIPPVAFTTLLRDVVPITDVWVGLIKAPLFGIIIAVTGCFHGLQVQGNAESVGHHTTQAVVQSIFLVIVLDAFFAVFFTAIGFI